MKGVPTNILLSSDSTGRSCFLIVDMNPLDPAEIHSPLLTPEYSGDLLFHHPKVSLGLIVGEGDGEILHECQDLFLVVATTIPEILCFRLFLSPMLSLSPRGLGDFRFLLRCFENLLILFFKGSDPLRRKNCLLFFCAIHRGFYLDEEVAQSFAPLMVVVLRDPPEFAQEVGVTESMITGRPEVWRPEVMDRMRAGFPWHRLLALLGSDGTRRR